MAELLENFIPRRTRGSYDWDQLFDGKPRRLESGVDFPGVAKNLRVSLYRKAKCLGLKVNVSISQDKRFIDVVSSIPENELDMAKKKVVKKKVAVAATPKVKKKVSKKSKKAC